MSEVDVTKTFIPYGFKMQKRNLEFQGDKSEYSRAKSNIN